VGSSTRWAMIPRIPKYLQGDRYGAQDIDLVSWAAKQNSQKKKKKKANKRIIDRFGVNTRKSRPKRSHYHWWGGTTPRQHIRPHRSARTLGSASRMGELSRGNPRAAMGGRMGGGFTWGATLVRVVPHRKICRARPCTHAGPT